MRLACESAAIWDFIKSLPNGLETIVGDRGHRLSGGEKQRLAIARLLLKSPRIVILDEATAHLDSENEELVQKALGNALIGRTSIVIAHRLSTIKSADQIIVLESGEIKEIGKHEELVAKGGIYSDLYQRQVLN
jgi:ATP-binding cassette subfamily B protein